MDLSGVDGDVIAPPPLNLPVQAHHLHSHNYSNHIHSLPPPLSITSPLRVIAERMASTGVWSRIRAFSTQPSTARTVTANLLGFATWIPVIAWFNTHVAELTVVDGASMYPFMNADRDSTLRRDVVFNYKWSPQDDLQRGMIVTLRYAYRGTKQLTHTILTSSH